MSDTTKQIEQLEQLKASLKEAQDGIDSQINELKVEQKVAKLEPLKIEDFQWEFFNHGWDFHATPKTENAKNWLQGMCGDARITKIPFFENLGLNYVPMSGAGVFFIEVVNVAHTPQEREERRDKALKLIRTITEKNAWTTTAGHVDEATQSLKLAEKELVVYQNSREYHREKLAALTNSVVIGDDIVPISDIVAVECLGEKPGVYLKVYLKATHPGCQPSWKTCNFGTRDEAEKTLRKVNAILIPESAEQ